MNDSTDKGGAPEGNDNRYRGSIIQGAIRRALNERSKQGRDSLSIVVAKMLDDAEDGDREARRELFDRLDGKPKQMTEVSGPNGKALELAGLPWSHVEPAPPEDR